MDVYVCRQGSSTSTFEGHHGHPWSLYHTTQPAGYSSEIADAMLPVNSIQAELPIRCTAKPRAREVDSTHYYYPAHMRKGQSKRSCRRC